MAGWDPLWYNPVYMKRFSCLLADLLAASVAAASTGGVIRTAAELQAVAFDRAEAVAIALRKHLLKM